MQEIKRHEMKLMYTDIYGCKCAKLASFVEYENDDRVMVNQPGRNPTLKTKAEARAIALKLQKQGYIFKK